MKTIFFLKNKMYLQIFVFHKLGHERVEDFQFVCKLEF
jgi:hypothetical protein